MAARRLAYLAALSGCAVFYIAYGEWFSYLALVLMVLLPWLSLVLSLPVMLSFRVSVEGADTLPVGTPGELWLQGRSRLPMPPFRGRIRLRRCFDDTLRWYDSREGLPTAHCGSWIATGEQVRICDYLGLFAFPVRCDGPRTVCIRPLPVPIDDLPGLDSYLARAWKPKPGGGFAENHELRPFRPGDNLNQIHWKLTAKAGKWMLREPMEPQRGLVLVTMELRGSDEELDRKLGQLLWLGQLLLEKDLPFRLQVLTGQGLLTCEVTDEDVLTRQLSLLLRSGTTGDPLADRACAASWHYHIGGDGE